MNAGQDGRRQAVVVVDNFDQARVDRMVVPAARGGAVFDAGQPAELPGFEMVDLAMFGRHRAPGNHAPAVPGEDRLAHVVGEVPFRAPQVQDLALAVHDDGNGPAIAEVLPQFRGAQLLAVPGDAAGARAFLELGQGGDDDHVR